MLSLAIDNTNTPNRAPRSGIGTKVRSEALRSSDAGNVPDFTSAPAESASDAISATHSNSRASLYCANAGDGFPSPVAGTHSNLQALSVPVDVTGEGFPAILQPSPVIAIPLPIAESQADRPLASAGANAASLFYSTWSPWSVCKGSI